MVQWECLLIHLYCLFMQESATHKNSGRHKNNIGVGEGGRNIVQFLDIQRLIYFKNIVSDLMRKFILIKVMNIIAEQPQLQRHKQQ